MDVDKILNRYNLERKNATRYIDAITRLNQSDTAEEIGVSRQTVSRYKNAFKEMTDNERTLLIAALTQEKLFEQAAER
jgi:transcriptional regulator with XRE-family HTH domain